jgi:hypothetical protein
MRSGIAVLCCTHRMIPSRIQTLFVRRPLPKKTNTRKLDRWLGQNKDGFMCVHDVITVTVVRVKTSADERIVVEQIWMEELDGVDILTYSGDRNSRLAEAIPGVIASGMDALPKRRFEFVSPERKIEEVSEPVIEPAPANRLPAHHVHRFAASRAGA